MKLNEIPGIQKLSLSDKIILLEEFWDDLRTEAESLPVPGRHKNIVRERLKKFNENEEFLTTEELKTRLEK